MRSQGSLPPLKSLFKGANSRLLHSLLFHLKTELPSRRRNRILRLTEKFPMASLSLLIALASTAAEPPSVSLILAGMLFAGVGTALTWACFFHWPATQRRFGAWWFNGWYPASRLGAISSALTCLWVGLFMLAVSQGWQEKMNETVVGWLMAVWALWMVIMAIRDYWLHHDL